MVECPFPGSDLLHPVIFAGQLNLLYCPLPFFLALPPSLPPPSCPIIPRSSDMRARVLQLILTTLRRLRRYARRTACSLLNLL